MHVFGDRTVDVTFLQINQAASYRMTHQPVVYAALDEDLPAELFPEYEVCLFHLIEELWRYEHSPYS